MGQGWTGAFKGRAPEAACRMRPRVGDQDGSGAEGRGEAGAGDRYGPVAVSRQPPRPQPSPTRAPRRLAPGRPRLILRPPVPPGARLLVDSMGNHISTCVLCLLQEDVIGAGGGGGGSGCGGVSSSRSMVAVAVVGGGAVVVDAPAVDVDVVEDAAAVAAWRITSPNRSLFDDSYHYPLHPN